MKALSERVHEYSKEDSEPFEFIIEQRTVAPASGCPHPHDSGASEIVTSHPVADHWKCKCKYQLPSLQICHIVLEVSAYPPECYSNDYRHI